MSEQNWIRHLTTAVEEASEVPLFGRPPHFNKEAFLEQLKSSLQIDDLSLEMKNEEWREEDALLKGMGKNPTLYPFSLAPMTGHGYIALSQKDAKHLSEWTLTPTQREFNFQDADVLKGYLRFVMCEVMSAFRASGAFPEMSPRFEESELKLERSFAIDMGLHSKGASVWGRLLIPRSLQTEVKRHYSMRFPSLHELKVHSKMMLKTSLTAGTTQLMRTEIEKLEQGDFLVLDHCSYHPDTKKGYLQLNLGTHPLLQVKLRGDHLKVLDYAFEIEGAPVMDKQDMPQDSSPIEDILNEGEGVYGADDLSGFEGSDEQLPEGDPSMAGAPAEGQPYPEGMPSHAPEMGQVPGAPEGADHMAAGEPLAEVPPAQPADSQAHTSGSTIERAAEEPIVSPGQVPLTLTVEVTKLNISLEKLLELQPGNVLNTTVTPEAGVNLCLGGRPIGKGELLNLGDAIGIKITEIANK